MSGISSKALVGKYEQKTIFVSFNKMTLLQTTMLAVLVNGKIKGML